MIANQRILTNANNLEYLFLPTAYNVQYKLQRKICACGGGGILTKRATILRLLKK